jgi:hypothetical protein
MTNEIDTIIDKALSEVGHNFIDGEIVETMEAFERFMFQLAKALFPNHKFSIPEPGTILGQASWTFTLEITDIFKKMKPFSPGHNRDIIVKVLERQLIRRDTFSQLEGQNPIERFNPEKLILVPKMGSAVRNGPSSSKFLETNKEEAVMLSRPAYGYVHSVPAINEPTHLMFVPKLALPMIGLSEEEIFAKALQNLKSKAEKVTVKFEDDVAFIGEDTMDGMPSQLIFHPDFWKALSQQVGDHLFVHVVEHNEVIVCKSRARDIIFNLVTGVAMGNIGSLLPATFFTYDDDGFRLFAKMLPDSA